MVVNFPTANGVGEMQGDLCLARECYMASIGMAWGVKTPQRKIEENPVHEETFDHKKDVDGEKEREFPLVISFLFGGAKRPKDGRASR